MRAQKRSEEIPDLSLSIVEVELRSQDPSDVLSDSNAGRDFEASF